MWYGVEKGNRDRVTSDSFYLQEKRGVRESGARVLTESAYRRLVTFFNQDRKKTASPTRALRHGSGKRNGDKRFRRGQLGRVQRTARGSGPGMMHIQEQGVCLVSRQTKTKRGTTQRILSALRTLELARWDGQDTTRQTKWRKKTNYGGTGTNHLAISLADRI
ncbi:hypothetical protein BJX64DRAFT_45936 [Aspergillus heterothallicus]